MMMNTASTRMYYFVLADISAEILRHSVCSTTVAVTCRQESNNGDSFPIIRLSITETHFSQLLSYVQSYICIEIALNRLYALYVEIPSTVRSACVQETTDIVNDILQLYPSD